MQFVFQENKIGNLILAELVVGLLQRLHSKDSNHQKMRIKAVVNPAVTESTQVVQGKLEVTAGWKAIGARRRVRPL